MALEAVLFGFNNVIIQDESIQEEVIEEILLRENLRYDSGDYRRFCLGRSDRAGLRELLAYRGRMVSEDYLTKLIKLKTAAYRERLLKLESIPLYPGLIEFLKELQKHEVTIGIVTGASSEDVELVLAETAINRYFKLILTSKDVSTSNPEPDGYLLATQRLQISGKQCLAVETTFLGIEAAKKANIPVLGLANLYPVHMLQRRANWTVDRLNELELERFLLK